MSTLVPFTVHIKVIPKRPGTRWSHLRDLQKIAVLAHHGLAAVSGVTVAEPGGGQHAQFADIDRRGSQGSFARGTAAKPQIGNSPAQLMLTGFYQVATNNNQAVASTQRISGGKTYTGYVQHPNDAVPASAVLTQVKALKTALTSALTSALPSSVSFSIFRLEYQGIVYGNKGYHFPQ
jgi:hypothetical protein